MAALFICFLLCALCVLCGYQLIERPMNILDEGRGFRLK